MYIAEMAGIKVFATGGIGGVHRNAETTMDISADLEELAQTDVCVISAGAKAILDLGLTLEYLETKGVPVLGYQTDVLPAFYSRESDFKVNFNVHSPKEIADFINTKHNLGLKGGILVANPIPKAYSMDKAFINQAIEEALVEMDALGIKGKETTPYLLGKIVELTKGNSLASNIQLVYNNCKLAAQISVELNTIEV
jgi:pseudouridine-5'-phosphate glycosidase